MQCCNKRVIIYSGARVSEFIRAIRSFISIDAQMVISKKLEWNQLGIILFTLHVHKIMNIGLIRDEDSECFSDGVTK